MYSELGSASPQVDNWAVRSTLLSASLRLFLLVALCLSASITEAQKTVRLIEIHSGWGGLGTSQDADVIIRSKDGAFVRDGKPVDAAQVEVLFEDGGDLLGGLISVDEQLSFFICRPGQASGLCSPQIAPNYIARFTQSSNLDQRRSLQLARVVVRANYQKCSRQTWPADI